MKVQTVETCLQKDVNKIYNFQRFGFIRLTNAIFFSRKYILKIIMQRKNIHTYKSRNMQLNKKTSKMFIRGFFFVIEEKMFFQTRIFIEYFECLINFYLLWYRKNALCNSIKMLGDARKFSPIKSFAEKKFEFLNRQEGD